MGAIEAEYFISIILKEKADYTKWRQEFFDNMTGDEIFNKAVFYAKKKEMTEV